MTGYGQSIRASDAFIFTVDIKSVNHRHLEIVFRMPREWQHTEDRLRRLIQNRLHRGRIDVFVSAERNADRPRKAIIDWALAEAYRDAGRQLSDRFQLTDAHALSVKDFLTFPDVVRFVEDAGPEEGLEELYACAEEALDLLIAAREAEGRFLADDIGRRCATIGCLVARMEQLAPTVAEDYRSRLQYKLEQWVEPAGVVDPGRIAMEAAIFAERAGIDEELTRLRSHAEQFSSLIAGDAPAGRKLDFLLQEMNREANTIGAKANHLGLSNLVVELKSEIEKLREQAQNIE
jgi:uncharacterized protein (TIGR00255 family)